MSLVPNEVDQVHNELGPKIRDLQAQLEQVTAERDAALERIAGLEKVADAAFLVSRDTKNIGDEWWGVNGYFMEQLFDALEVYALNLAGSSEVQP